MGHYIYLILLAIGLIFLAMAYRYYNEVKVLLSNGKFTSGVVIAEKEEFGYRSNTYRPKFSYTDINGETHVFESEVSTRPRTLHVGDTITVVYDPFQLKVASFWGLYRMPVIFLCIALPFLFISILYGIYLNFSHQG